MVHLQSSWVKEALPVEREVTRTFFSAISLGGEGISHGKQTDLAKAHTCRSTLGINASLTK